MKKIATVSVCLLLLVAAYLSFCSQPDIRNAQPGGTNVICFGDSLTAGTGATKNMDYPSQLSRMISTTVINAGIPGDTTETALERLKRDVLTKSPRIVLITIGGNDLKNGVARDTAHQNLKTIILSIQDEGALVIVGGIQIPFLGRGYGEMYETVCRETRALLIPNIFEGIIGRKELMSDPIHPNDRGYTLMAEKFYEAMQPYL